MQTPLSYFIALGRSTRPPRNQFRVIYTHHELMSRFVTAWMHNKHRARLVERLTIAGALDITVETR